MPYTFDRCVVAAFLADSNGSGVESEPRPAVT